LSDRIAEIYKRYLYPAISTYYQRPLTITKGKGSYVYDSEGNEYLDFFGGVVTISVGHSNRYVLDKVTVQMEKLQHISSLYPTEPAARLA